MKCMFKKRAIPKWTLVIIAVPWVYLLSVGPAYHISRAVGAENVFRAVYGPVINHVVTPRSLLGDPLEMYLNMWGVPVRQMVRKP